MGVIYFLRHAQAPASAYAGAGGATRAAALTAVGRAQAGRAAQALQERVDKIDYAVSGDLPRQRETLGLALKSDTRTMGPQVDPRWNEYDLDAVLGGQGVAAELSGAVLQAAVDDALAHWVRSAVPTLPDTESYADYGHRCAEVFRDVTVEAGSGRTVLVVSSAGTISQVLAQIWGLDGQQWINLSRNMINASFSKVIVGRRGVSVVSVNEHGHLEGGVGSAAGNSMTYR